MAARKQRGVSDGQRALCFKLRGRAHALLSALERHDLREAERLLRQALADIEAAA